MSATTTKAPAKGRQAVEGQVQQQQETTVDENLDDANISDDEEGGMRIGDIYIPPPIKPYCSTESKGSRLIITKIVNNNFKSYAERVVLGPLHQSFTAIIGPNGSGKSNVIDSMLFVFGYRANKIRCKKISTLLHKSAKFPNVTKCSVEVHFEEIEDNADGTYKTLPNSQFYIERAAFADNSSYYTIAGKRVQFKHVAKLLKQHDVDLDHNRFLILQGEVESISLMKPKGMNENECGMLEYLEDIVGTTRYKEPLVKINARVDELTEERTEKLNRCKMAEREMKDMEQPYNEAVEFLRKENEFTRTKNLRIQKQICDQKNKGQDAQAEHDKINDELKEHDEAAAALQKEREEKQALIQEEERQFEELKKNRDRIQREWQESGTKFTEVQESMQLANQRRKQNKAQLVKCEEEVEQLKKVPNENIKEIDECEKKLEKLNDQVKEKDEELQRNYELLKNETQPLIEKRTTLENSLIDIMRVVEDAREQLAVAESQLKVIRHDEITETRKYDTMKTSIEDSESDLQQKLDRVEQLRSNILTQLKQDYATKSQEFEQLKANEELLMKQLRVIENEINERQISMQSAHSNNKVLNHLMRLKNEGKIPGILGRLGDLGGIDSKYDVAISTACGRLDNIVVETVDDAQRCIEELRSSNVGRASFMALEKIAHYGNQGPIRTPENVPRLFDLVVVEDRRVVAAFYFALRDCLVANDLTQATRIGYGAKRYRVVTLQGQTIELAGTMSGGGRTQSRGKMGTSVKTSTRQSKDASVISPQAMEEMRIKAQELQTQINFCQQEQGRLERELRELKTALQRNESELQKLQVQAKSLQDQLPRIQKQLLAQKKRMEDTHADANKVQESEAEIKVKKQHLEKEEKKSKEYEKQIADIKAKIDDIHNQKVKVIKSKITTLNTQIKKLNANVTKLRVDIKTAERNVNKKERQIEQLRADITQAETDIREMNTRREQHDLDTVRLANELKAAETAITTAKSTSSGAQQEVVKLKKLESDNKLKRIEIDEKLKNIKVKLKEILSTIPYLQAMLKPLKLNEIPGQTEPVPPLKTYTEEELSTHKLQDIQYKESVQEEETKKKPNLSCIDEYINKRDVYLERVQVLEDITSKRNELRNLYDNVRKRRHSEFMHGFSIITRRLKEMYQLITQGGNAELELVDSMDPFTEGISFSVRPTRKTWKNISNLSGGEKTLSSLALVFALHYYKPSPLYFMDEIDAALDFKNISIVANYIKNRTKNAQFIIISLRTNMFELSNRLVGIYKVQDCTFSVAIDNTFNEAPIADTQITASTQPTTQATVIEMRNILTTPEDLNAIHVAQLSTVNESLNEYNLDATPVYAPLNIIDHQIIVHPAPVSPANTSVQEQTIQAEAVAPAQTNSSNQENNIQSNVTNDNDSEMHVDQQNNIQSSNVTNQNENSEMHVDVDVSVDDRPRSTIFNPVIGSTAISQQLLQTQTSVNVSSMEQTEIEMPMTPEGANKANSEEMQLEAI